ncbi:hypothetical protein B0H13DRAFT_2320026 [Mycena leptocephala]|nr:hypothetical protein B0H13DRAFT_2320026 [Mycena leptocephala]
MSMPMAVLGMIVNVCTSIPSSTPWAFSARQWSTLQLELRTRAMKGMVILNEDANVILGEFQYIEPVIFAITDSIGTRTKILLESQDAGTAYRDFQLILDKNAQNPLWASSLVLRKRIEVPSVAVWDLGMMTLEQPTYSQSFERLFAGSLDNFQDSGEKIRAAAINIKEKGVQLQDTKPDVPHVLRAVSQP